jgi:hypothetical protein
VRRLICIALAATALVPVAATAGAALKQKAVEFAVPADTETEETAKCKRGQEAVAGGFFVDPSPMGGVFPTFESQRVGKRGWNYRLYSFPEADAAVYAYCDKREPGLKVESATEELPDESIAALTARCGRGKEAVAGGFDSPFTELAAVASKRSGKRSWEVVFVGPPGAEVTAIAYCDKREPGLKTKQVAIVPQIDEVDSVRAKCKRKQELRSGGFEIEFDALGTIDEDEGLVTTSRRAGKRRWEVAGSAIDGEPEMVAYAYCDKKEKK